MPELRVIPSDPSSRPPRIRRSKSSKRRATVLVLVHVAIAAHLTHWLVAGRTMTPLELSEAAALARHGVVNAGLVFFAVMILLTAVLGRFFCGWGCHLVALQDACRALLERLGHKPRPLRSRLLRWVPILAFFYAFLWPALHRARIDFGPLETEWTTADFWATFPGWIVGGLTFLVCGALAVYFLGAKGFCTYACPYGAIFAGAERLAPFRIRVTDACAGCGHCTAVCTSNVRVHEEVRDFGMVVDSGCMKCLDCVSVCPKDALYYGIGAPPLLTKRRARGTSLERFPLRWSEEIVAALAFVAAFLTFRGLYGQIPFLMALGLAGVLAFLVLLTTQLWTRPNLAFRGFQLKRGGRLLPAASGLLTLMAVVGALWLHSAVVRVWIAQGDAATDLLARHHAAALSPTPPTLTTAERRRLAGGRAAYARAERVGWIATAGAAPRIALMSRLLGEDDAARRFAELALARDEMREDMALLLRAMERIPAEPEDDRSPDR